MRFKEYLSESVNDKGIFKAIFMAGTPGAGKSYTLKSISSGAIEPRIVNTDKMAEFLAKANDLSLAKDGDAHTDEFWDNSTHLTTSQLSGYINGMLPLFIDGTSGDINNLVNRIGILEYFGYDVGMVWVETDLDTAIDRASKRDRHVDPDFIRQVHELAEENKEFYKSKFGYFTEVNNNDGELTDSAIMTAYKSATSFFESPIKNPIGKRNLSKLLDNKEKYLVPSIYSAEDVKKHLNSWYKR